jgi:hypothetical protein
MSDDFTRFTTPRADEELHQGVEAPVVMGVSPEDGLPMQVAQRNFDKAPVLSEETLICMADKRSFVVRWEDGSIRAEYAPFQVKRLENGEYYVPLSSEALAAFDRTDHAVLRQGDNPVCVLRVEPIRPECAHYLRQQTDLSADREGRYYARACMAQKTEDGEYYSLRDTLVGACSIRSPRHLESEVALLDKFDEEKMSEALNLRSMAEFDVDKELAEEARKGGLGVLGG